ncbi:11298_t:CDS:2 [Scutellospora calospora]|uniref:11298_t:CDS:1 n=1 Tax=Scutellospora calospora TaxID=85575 RepID=A0ACA9K4W7_9GLOM|nr:11298_t:CDS:2 [Scutellospora calospora]
MPQRHAHASVPEPTADRSRSRLQIKKNVFGKTVEVERENDRYVGDIEERKKRKSVDILALSLLLYVALISGFSFTYFLHRWLAQNQIVN